MKNYLIYFLLFSTVGFSQNYQYSLEEGKIPPPVLLPTGVNNQKEEIEYFKAYLLPIAQKANLQKALDTYGSVRLEKGDYSGVDVIMHSNQSLYGHPTLTRVSNITIASGSSNVFLSCLSFGDRTLAFEAGAVISGCVFKTMKYVYIQAIGAKLENNELIDIGGQIKFDCSVSGYFRNNKIIKHQAQGISNQLVMKGNTTTPSYGNVNLHSNYLTPAGDATDIDGLQSATFVGIDSEGWNLTGQGTKAMFSAKNMGNIKISNFGGGNAYSQVRTGAFDIDAQNVFFLDKGLQTSSDILSPRTNMFLVNGGGSYLRGAGTVTGYDLLCDLDNSHVIKYNGIEQTFAMSNAIDVAKITNSILGTQFTPWARPTWENLPDPMGANWKTNRVGKPDQTAYIQGLIDTNGVAELPEGIFYIGSTLNIPLDSNHGIVGKGTGKTVIIGLTDDFPLLTLDIGTDANFTLANLTLQGGSVGLYAGTKNGVGIGQIAYQNLKYIVFRDQNYGIQLHQIFGLDNNFFEHLAFVNCNKGFFQDPLLPYVNQDITTSSYVDKTLFYQNQFINCSTAIYMMGTRPNNLNIWLDCKFDGGKTAFVMGCNYPIIANSDFSNYTSGDYVISSNCISIYSSNFFNNSPVKSIVSSVKSYVEGCNFLDNINPFSPVVYNPTFQYVLNSTITGDVVVPKPSNLYYLSSAVYSNSKLLANPSLSKLLVNVNDGLPTVVINAAPNPYPQLLVTQ